MSRQAAAGVVRCLRAPECHLAGVPLECMGSTSTPFITASTLGHQVGAVVGAARPRAPGPTLVARTRPPTGSGLSLGLRGPGPRAPGPGPDPTLVTRTRPPGRGYCRGCEAPGPGPQAPGPTLVARTRSPGRGRRRGCEAPGPGPDARRPHEGTRSWPSSGLQGPGPRARRSSPALGHQVGAIVGAARPRARRSSPALGHQVGAVVGAARPRTPGPTRVARTRLPGRGRRRGWLRARHSSPA